MKVDIKKLANAIAGSFLLSLGIGILASYAINSLQTLVFLISLAGFAYWFYKSEPIKRIWARTFAGLSIVSFLIPISVFIFGIKATAKQQNVLSAAGTAIGTGVATIFIGVLAFFIGMAFLVAAYFTFKSIPKKKQKT